jgi:hypothetical protein
VLCGVLCAAQSFIGAAGAWVMPLRLERDGCDLDKAAALERRTFWLLHAGNLAVNVGGTVVLAELWRQAAAGFALGDAVGLVQIYTLPRMPAAAAVTPVADGWAVTLARTFWRPRPNDVLCSVLCAETERSLEGLPR